MTRTGIKLDLDVGDLVSNAGRARGAISALTDAMKKAEQEGRWDDYSRLAFDRDKLQNRNTGFERDIKNFASNPRFQTQTPGGTVFKVDSEYAGLIKSQIDAMKRLTADYEEAIRNGDMATARELSPQIDKQQADFHKLVEDANKPTGSQAAAGALKAIGINQISTAINDGFSRWVGSLDRSGIVNQYGSGDILGGRIAEERRQADLTGGILQSVLSIGGTALGFAFGGLGGAMLGGTLGGGAGKAISTALQGPINEEATAAAHAGLWQQRATPAMELAAIIGSPGGVREAFKTAADAAAQFGYSAEEGMDAIKEAARQGLSGKDAETAARQVFDYERRTGADRGTLSSVANMSARYGGGDALRMGWAGLQASGMNPGQYNEYLRAMQRVMEDGISKGFVRSSDQVVQNLTMLSQMTGNDPLWQGENGARRLSEMNAGLESATSLSSTSDIIAYRAARQMAGEGSSYVDVMKILEGGLTPELFRKYMSLTSSAEGGGREGIVERMRQTFNLNYTNADRLYGAWQKNPSMSDTDMQALIDKYKNEPPAANSPELDAAKTTEAIKNWWTQTGQVYWDEQLPKLSQELGNAIHGFNEKNGSHVPIPGEVLPLTPDESRKAVDDTLANLEMASLNPAISGDELRRLQNEAIDAQVAEGMRLGRINSMLMQNGFSDTPSFFHGNGNPFTKNDDERAYANLQALDRRAAPDSTERDYLDRAYAQLGEFNFAQRREADTNNSLNSVLMKNELTAQKLYEAVIELSRQMNVRVIAE